MFEIFGWVCYMIISLDSHCTYIGSTNNFIRRLNNHNRNDPNIKRTGAKRTRGQTWIPALVVSGFSSKNACLSFEAGWKRLSKKRNNRRLYPLNIVSEMIFRYGSNPRWNRIMDLLYFTNNFTLLENKFKMNHSLEHKIILPEKILISIFVNGWSEYIKKLPWPYFISAEEVGTTL
ncbi:MAG: putative endo/excinuclease amino terminal domain protein [Satyrvirus sp.]|uniref:Putative endo/excinuclease amino terminal domain protein n=1 Tax=Satyrvirus sp. TaxID=2487771 RepID=A0A3G5ACX5_9VIRU|nr:MAG: putative endo/excinuclease amino terminal domain protein [Satyrvirus sp.]